MTSIRFVDDYDIGVGPVTLEIQKAYLSACRGGEARWDYLAVDSGAHRLYVSHGTRTEVVDTQANRLVGTIPDTAGVHGIAIAGDRHITRRRA